MRVLLVGFGSIGRRHLANLKTVEPDASITVWRQHTRPPDAETDSPHTVYSLEDALKTKPHAAVVTGPASRHIETALELARHGIHLLVEKPLSNKIADIDVLLETCRSKRLTLLVGYNFRFHQPLLTIKKAIEENRIGRVLAFRAEMGRYLPDWRPASDYREGVSAKAALGGGVLFELSHEVDYARWLVGEITDVSARVGRVSELEVDVEDTAEMNFEFENGALGNIHLDMIDRAPIRSCRIVGSEGTLSWNGITQQASCYSAASGIWTDLCTLDAANFNDMYVAELRHLFDCARGVATPAVTGEDGRRVVQITLAAKQSSLERRAVVV